MEQLTSRKKLLSAAVIIAAFLLLCALVTQHLRTFPNSFLNNDEYYHAALIKAIVEDGSYDYFDRQYWGTISFNYPPLFPIAHAFLVKGLAVNNIIAYAKTASVITLVALLGVYVYLVRTLRRSWLVVGLSILLFSMSYFPMNRIVLFLPENLALVIFLFFIITMLKSHWRLPLRFGILTSLLFLSILTNLLTATIMFALVALWVPISLLRNQRKEALGFVLIGALNFILSLQLQFIDTFWVRYLYQVTTISLITSAFIIVYRVFGLQRLVSVRWKLVLITAGVATALVILLLDWEGSRLIWSRLLSERFYLLDDMPQRIRDAAQFFFWDNGRTHVGLHTFLTLVGLGSLFAMMRQIAKGQTKYTPILVITILSTLSLLFGPYIGIEPGSRNPRAALYLGLMIPITMSIVVSQYQLFYRQKWIVSIFLAVVFVTATPNVVRFMNQDSSIGIPKAVIENLDKRVKPNEKILLDSATLLEYFSRSRRDTSSLASSIDLPMTDIITNQDPGLLVQYNVQYIIANDRNQFSELREKTEAWKPVFSQEGYTIYYYNPAGIL